MLFGFILSLKGKKEKEKRKEKVELVDCELS